MVGKMGGFGLVWFGLVWFGLVWFGLVWLGWVFKGRLVMSGLIGYIAALADDLSVVATKVAAVSSTRIPAV